MAFTFALLLREEDDDSRVSVASGATLFLSLDVEPAFDVLNTEEEEDHEDCSRLLEPSGIVTQPESELPES